MVVCTVGAVLAPALPATAAGAPPIANDDSYAVDQGATLTVGAASGVLANDSDPEGDALTAALVGNPVHGTVDLDADGSFSYDPDSGFTGTDAFTYVANDGTSASPAATVEITVRPDQPANRAPIAKDLEYRTAEDVAKDIELDASDPDGDAITFAVTDDPDDGTVTCAANSGRCTYTPDANFFGVDSFGYVARDSAAATSGPARVTVTVTAVNDPPIARDVTVDTVEEQAVSFSLVGSDPVEGSPVEFVIDARPAHGTLSPSCGPGASCTYTPDANFSGTDTFTYRSTDGDAFSTRATVTITVDNLNDPPVAGNQMFGTSEDQPFEFDLVASDADGDRLTFDIVTEPARGVLQCTAAGHCTYNPPADFTGQVTFTFRALDESNAASNVATVTIDIDNENDAPRASNQAVTTDEDTPAKFSLTATDIEGDPLTYSVDAKPAHGTATCTKATGRCTYTPAADYHGPDSFTFYAFDGQARSNSARVSITVTPVNDAPSALTSAYTTGFNEPLRVSAPGVLAGATDVEGDPITAVAVRQPQHGSVVVNKLGGFRYDPDPQFKGVDTFTFRAQDDHGAASPAVTVTIGVEVPVSGAGPVRFVGTDAAEERGFLSSLPRGLHADLRGGGDTYDVFFGALRGPVQVNDSGASGTDTLVTLGGAGNDRINLRGKRVLHGPEHVSYARIETIAVRGLQGSDRIGIGSAGFPATLKHITADGGPGDDELVVKAGNRAAQVRGNQIFVHGWPVITYSGFEKVTVNSAVTGERVISSEGYWLLASDGGVFTFGDAKFYGSTGGLALQAPIIQMIATPSGRGYWLLASDGGVFTFGDAKFFGSTGGLRLRAPVVQMIATTTGRGYWLRASDGGIFTFGDAKFYGSTGGLALSAPIIDMIPSPTGKGYWLLAANGSVFGFGAARYHGAAATAALTSRIVQLVPTPSGNGYWLVAADGSVFAFGNAGYYGSMIGKHVNADIVQMIATPTGNGYWLLGRDGGIFTFGDAEFHGSTGGLPLKQPITRMIIRGL
jgi:hypothetical protein